MTPTSPPARRSADMADVVSPDEFRALVAAAQARDPDAAVRLARLAGPVVQRAVRYRLGRWKLANALDPDDIAQGVLAEFFARLGKGELRLDDPARLNALLARMAEYRVVDEVRKCLAARRGGGDRPATNVGEVLGGVAANTGTPSEQVRADDLLEHVYARLTAEERALADRRARGDDWADIAAAVGGTPDALRKKLGRALDRALAELKLE